MKLVIIGLGGVGSILCERLARFLSFSNELENTELLLVDGDIYEFKNLVRQDFTRMGNKADVKSTDLKLQFPKLKVASFPTFINEVNLTSVITEGDVVFLCVDNHKTRMIVSNYCEKISNITLISGGNEYIDGNVQIYVRENNKDKTPSLCAYHPEIANPDDKLPEEMSCEELSQSDPQLYFTNLGVAFYMCCAFYNVVVTKKYEASETYFDIVKMVADAKVRPVR